MRWFNGRSQGSKNLLMIIALFFVISSILVFAQGLSTTTSVISVEFGEDSFQESKESQKLEYHFNRNLNHWEFRTASKEWNNVNTIDSTFNAKHQQLANSLVGIDEEGGYRIFDSVSKGLLGYGDATVTGLPPPENAQGTGITPGEPDAVIVEIGEAVIESGGEQQSCTSSRCQQIDQVWISIRSLLSGISQEAKSNIYDPATQKWGPLTRGTTPQQPAETPSENIITLPVDLRTRPTDPDQRLLWIYNTYKQSIDTAASESNVDRFLIVAIIDVESKGDPHIVSCTGAAGLMQFIVSTAQSLNLQTTENNPVVNDVLCDEINWETSRVCRKNNANACDFVHDERFDPELNIRTGAVYIRQLLDKSNNNLQQALLRYSGNNSDYYSKVIEKKEKIEKLMK